MRDEIREVTKTVPTKISTLKCLYLYSNHLFNNYHSSIDSC